MADSANVKYLLLISAFVFDMMSDWTVPVSCCCRMDLLQETLDTSTLRLSLMDFQLFHEFLVKIGPDMCSGLGVQVLPPLEDFVFQPTYGECILSNAIFSHY